MPNNVLNMGQLNCSFLGIRHPGYLGGPLLVAQRDQLSFRCDCTVCTQRVQFLDLFQVNRNKISLGRIQLHNVIHCFQFVVTDKTLLFCGL